MSPTDSVMSCQGDDAVVTQADNGTKLLLNYVVISSNLARSRGLSVGLAATALLNSGERRKELVPVSDQNKATKAHGQTAPARGSLGPRHQFSRRARPAACRPIQKRNDQLPILG